jgi:hypothetical protein
LPNAVMNAIKNITIQTVMKIPTAHTPRFQFQVMSSRNFRIHLSLQYCVTWRCMASCLSGLHSVRLRERSGFFQNIYRAGTLYPQVLQNFSPGATGLPQFVQNWGGFSCGGDDGAGAPHAVQNFSPARSGSLHCRHVEVARSGSSCCCT